jgi:hypothetical protein
VAKRQTKKITEASVAGAGMVDISELAGILHSTIPELAEAYTRADIELALDDRGWLTQRNQLATTELDTTTRVAYVNKSRMYWLRDPMAKQAVRLWTDYAMGTGISYSSKDKSIEDAIRSFMKHRANRRVMSSEGQRKSSKKLLIDGEVFFGIFKGKDGKKIVRLIDPVQITHVISDPDDVEHILAYRRVLPPRPGRQEKSIFYIDWTCNAEDRALAKTIKIDNQAVVLEEDVVVYHLPFDALYQRGNGLLTPVVDWAREHRRFMEARVAITQALSKYAHKLTVKGGQGTVDRIKGQLQSSYAKSGAASVERNPQTAPASTWVQNDGMDLQAIPKATGAGDSEKDSNQLKLQICAGVNIMLHYFGDPSTGNLATATAMELPMLKAFESYQELWKDAYTDIFNIVMDEDSDDGVDEGEDGEAIDITVDLPPILADDLGALSTAFSGFANLWPELADDDEILTMVLTAMRVANVDAVLKNMRKLKEARKQEDAQQQEKMAKLMGGAAPKDPAKAALAAAQMSSKESERLTEALLKVAEGLHI